MGRQNETTRNRTDEVAEFVLNQNFDILEEGIPPCLCCIDEPSKEKKLNPFVSMFDEEFRDIILDMLVISVKQRQKSDCEAILHFNGANMWVFVQAIPRNFDDRILIEVRLFDISKRKYIEDSVSEKVSFPKSLVKIGTIFSSSNDISLAIAESMKLIMNDLKVHTLSIYRDIPDEEHFVLDKYEIHPDLAANYPTDSVLPYRTVLGFKKVLEEQGIIVSESPDEKFTAVLRNRIQLVGIESFVCAPIFITGKFYGVLVAANAHERHWAPQEIDFIHASALILGQNIDREIIKKQILTTRNDFVNIFNNASDLVFIVNLDGTIIEANATATKATGYERNELLGKHVEDISINSAGIEPVMAGEMHQSRQLIFGTSLKKKSGELVPIEVREKIVTYNNRKCILTIARDITDRKQFDRLILQTIIETEERERKRFAEALHDDLGPLLSALKIYTNLLVNKKFDPRSDVLAMEQMNQIIEQAIQTTKQTAANLMPNVLADFGLVEAVTDFVSKVATTKVIDLTFDCEIRDAVIKGNTSKVLFGVVKELINNTIKHSKAQSAKLTMVKEQEKLAILFEDNGTGFDFNQMLRNENNGMGIKNIVSKIDSLGGTIRTNKVLPHGFSIAILLEFTEVLK